MKFHHLGIAVKNIESSISNYIRSFGWVKKTEIIFDPIQNVKVVFMRDESKVLFELIEPANENSPVNKLLDKRISLYHFCYVVDNIEETINQLTNNQFLLITGPVCATAFNDKLIAFMINSDNLIVELLEK